MHKSGLPWQVVLPALILGFGVVFITYGIARHESLPLLSTYTVCFVAYLMVLYHTRQQSASLVRWLLGFAFLCRLLLLPAIPNLSDDVYRFIWDGRLWNQGINPFAYLPSEIMASGLYQQLSGIDTTLFRMLNSPDYFTIYPPVNQLIFSLATWLFPHSVTGSIIMIRLCILLAEGLNLILLYQLLQQVRWPVRYGLLYAFNPLVILELTGNLHFEALMLTFLLSSLYFFNRGQRFIAALFFALAVCTKLIPLILLPLYFRRLGWRKAFYFYGVVGCTTLLLFLPLLSRELITGMSQSLGLYFQKFEFNASIYYIVREIGFWVKGYNIIGTAGKGLAVFTLLLILWFSVKEKHRQLPAAFLWVLLIYLLLSTTVHPWYIIPLLAFSIFTPYRFTIVWTGLIFFSYLGYTAEGYQEPFLITLLEYGIVLGTLVYELSRDPQRPFWQILGKQGNPKANFISFIP